MTKGTVDIKAGWLFPFHFLILGGIFLFAGFIVIVDHPIAATILIFLALLILTAYEGTEIDPALKTVREYNSFLFFKTGKPKKYSGIEGIVIHKAKVSQKMFTARTMQSSTFLHFEYHAYLSLVNDDKIFLKRDKKKMRLLARMGIVAKTLNTSVVDHAILR